MGFNETMLIYLLIGTGVAVAVFLQPSGVGQVQRAFRIGAALCFWPLFVPLLAAPAVSATEQYEAASESDEDELSIAIRQVEAELDQALASLDDWADNVLAHERERLDELRAAWSLQAQRIREMDALLREAKSAAAWPPVNDASQASDAQRRASQSESARQHNIELLHGVRDRAYDDLFGTLAWVRELVSMIHLAKFTGAPASRAEELVTQIAAAVEGVSLVTGQNLPPIRSAAFGAGADGVGEPGGVIEADGPHAKAG